MLSLLFFVDLFVFNVITLLKCLCISSYKLGAPLSRPEQHSAGSGEKIVLKSVSHARKKADQTWRSARAWRRHY